ncbi:MAG: hypothetical protein ABL962_16010 [Fimbriimonadaceae bacterium]
MRRFIVIGVTTLVLVGLGSVLIGMYARGMQNGAFFATAAEIVSTMPEALTLELAEQKPES